MPQLLLELFSEEIPARMQAGAARDLERLARDGLAKHELAFEALRTFAGPRRLTLVVDGLPAATPDRAEELKGPKASAPPQALEGFLRKTGLTREELTERDGVLYATRQHAGRPTPEIAAEIVGEIVRSFPWPKSMRSAASSFRWVRPLKRVLFLFDAAVVPFEIEGVTSGDLTEGHRFMGPAAGQHFAVTGFDDYAAKLLEHRVVLDAADRKRRILEGARAACAARGLELVEDEGLLEEVAGLAEWPTPLIGDMDPAFLDLPGEVIRTSMRTHQKYFATRSAGEAGLAPHFVVVANIEATDGGAEIRAGNAKVLSARLSDARFFWDEDRKAGAFARWNDKLKGVTFHAKLGTLAERVERIAALAREIAPAVGADPDLAERAARLAKADLASAMVGEFPELQGVMGGYYARLAGEPDAVANAVRDHYKPVGPSDSVPTAPVTVAVALADKLDTLVGFFAIDEKPTGSKDPYALRRAALGVMRIIIGNRARLPLTDLLKHYLGVRVRQAEIQKLDEALVALQDPNFFSFHRFVYESAWSGFASAYIRVPDEMYYAVVGRLTPADYRPTYDQAMREPWSDRADDLVALRILERDPVSNSRDIDPIEARVSDWIVGVVADLLTFFADRLKVLLRDEGKRHDLVDAVFALGDDDLVRITDRVEALSAFLATEDGANLLAGYKRAVNILRAEAKKNPGEVITPHDLDQPGAGAVEEEQVLAETLSSVSRAVQPLLEAEDFIGAMQQLARLRTPVDAFFDKVLVNDPDPALRLSRLRLLASLQATANQVADFSLIQG